MGSEPPIPFGAAPLQGLAALLVVDGFRREVAFPEPGTRSRTARGGALGVTNRLMAVSPRASQRIPLRNKGSGLLE